MKKTTAILLIVSFIMSMVHINVFADLEAVSNNEKGVVVVKGTPGIEYSGSNVIIMALNNALTPETAQKDDILHIGSCTVDGYGSFRYKFSVETEEIQNLKLYVKQGVKNLTDTIVSAQISSFIKLNSYYDDKNKTLTLIADNVYWDSESIFTAAASYDEGGRLISFKKIDMDLSYLDSDKRYTIPFGKEM